MSSYGYFDAELFLSEEDIDLAESLFKIIEDEDSPFFHKLSSRDLEYVKIFKQKYDDYPDFWVERLPGRLVVVGRDKFNPDSAAYYIHLVLNACKSSFVASFVWIAKDNAGCESGSYTITRDEITCLNVNEMMSLELAKARERMEQQEILDLTQSLLNELPTELVSEHAGFKNLQSLLTSYTLQQFHLKNKKAYLSSQDERCIHAHCPGDSVNGGPVIVSGNKAHQQVSCNHCDAVWEDVYTKTDFIPIIE